MRTLIKRISELTFWASRKITEKELSNNHYVPFYTTHFGLTRRDYEGKRVLDIGCGPRGSLEWADMAAERVGLDPLAERYRALGTGRHRMRYVASGAESIPFPDGYFDVVCSFNSLDHVDDLDRVVAEIGRVVRPGGLFLLITDVNHKPTLTEPVCFSWDVVNRFAPTLRVASSARYEKIENGVYESLRRAVVYNDNDPSNRYGILTAKFVKPAQ
jgi:ubiquinone/menaquinone biosynthesis C-methylase UbiE